MKKLLILALFLVLVSGVFAVPGSKEEPYEISGMCQGIGNGEEEGFVIHYILTSDISGGACIPIDGNNIDFNLNGYTITSTSEAVIFGKEFDDLEIYEGVTAGINVHNITIYNGTIISGMSGKTFIFHDSNNLTFFDLNLIGMKNAFELRYSGIQNTIGVNNVIRNVNITNSETFLKMSQPASVELENITMTNSKSLFDEDINKLSNISYKNLVLNNNVIKNIWNAPSDRTYNLNEEINFVFDINYPNGESCSSFSYDLNLYPSISYTGIKEGCKLLVNFTPTKEGVYTFDLNVLIDNNISESGNFSFLVGEIKKKTSKTYYMRGFEPVNGSLIVYGMADSGAYLLTPPFYYEETRYCGVWIQTQIDEIYTYFPIINNVYTHTYSFYEYEYSANIWKGIQTFSTYGTAMDYNVFYQEKYLTEYVDGFYHTSFDTNFYDVNFSIDYLWQTYFFGTKLVGLPFAKSNTTDTTRMYIEYSTAGPELVQFKDIDEDYYDTELLASYYDGNSAVLIVDSDSDLNIVVDVSDKEFNINTILYDGVSCGVNSNCEVISNDGNIANVLISTGSVHTLVFEDLFKHSVANTVNDVNAVGFEDLNILIDGNVARGTFTGIKPLLFKDGDLNIISFDFNFSVSDFNLARVRIIKDENSIIVDLNGMLQSDQNKTLYIEDNGFTNLCVKDATITSISQISSTCTDENEFDFSNCLDGTQTISGIVCTDLGSTIRIENLKHSAILGSIVVPVQTNNNSGSSCTPLWNCSSWSECLDENQIRTCTKINNCGTALQGKPIEQQSCVVPIIPVVNCLENWNCSNWSECINSLQTRICTDTKDCNTINQKPIVQQNCTNLIINSSNDINESIDIGNDLNESSLSFDFGSVSGLVVFLVIFIVVVLFLGKIVLMKKK